MNKLEHKSVDETIYHQVLANGLTVYLLPKAGFSKSYVTFSTNLGSLQESIIKDGETLILPQGIAHFLEHKLFEQDGKDVSTSFSLNQASVNAYTQNNRTTYLFSCTDHLHKNIGQLLHFVQNPNFTEEGIKKEVQIITQEINMYKDDPNTALYQGVIENMYKDHPIRNEILGTVESISTITKDILEKTHSTFYHPSNMVLFVTGNFIPEETMSFIEANQVAFNPVKEYEETSVPLSCQISHVKEKTIEQEVKVPNFVLGVKLAPCTDQTQLLKTELSFSVLMDLIFGRSTDNFKQLLSNNLINDSFGTDITLSDSYSFFLIGSESNNPIELEKELRRILSNMKDLEITDELFLKTKKQTIGGFIQALNSLEYIANNFVKYYYSGTSLFDILQISKSITKEDIYDTMAVFLDDIRYTTCTVIPKKIDR